jgi:3-oxoacyl-[acyl-carrier protein] reductase
MSLQGKVAIVTGSARGIGATVAVSLAQAGADIVINYVSSSSKIHAEAVAKAVQSAGSQALVVQADLASLEALDSLVKKTVERFGKIDILVNNGGVVEFQPIGTITPETYQKIFDINVRAIVFLSQAVVSHMGEGGRIINVSSAVSTTGFPGSTVYSASKAAVEGITRVMAVELRDKGIRVTAINPGPVKTDMFLSNPKEQQDKITATYPTANPEDIADIITFLASPKSRWVNGGTVNANNAAAF